MAANYWALENLGQRYLAGELSPEETRSMALKHLMGGGDDSSDATGASPDVAGAQRSQAIESGEPLKASDVTIPGITQEGHDAIDHTDPNQKGRKVSLSNSDTDTSKHQVTQNLIRSPDEMRMMSMMSRGVYPRAAVDDYGNPVLDEHGNPKYDLSHTDVDPNHPIQKQEAAQKELEDLLRIRMAHTKPQINMDPMGEFLDRIGMPATNAPKQTGQNEVMQNKLFDELQATMKGKADVAKEMNSGMSQMKGGTAMDMYSQVQLAKLLEEQNNQNRFNPATAMNHIMTQSQKELGPLRQAEMTLSEVKRMLHGSPAEQNSVPLKMARIVEGARPAFAAASVENDPSLLTRWDNLWSRAKTGQMTPQLVKEFDQYINDMSGVSRKYIEATVPRLRASGSYSGIPDNVLDGVLPPAWLHPMDPTPGAPGAAAPKATKKGTGHKAAAKPAPDAVPDVVNSFLKGGK